MHPIPHSYICPACGNAFEGQALEDHQKTHHVGDDTHPRASTSASGSLPMSSSLPATLQGLVLRGGPQDFRLPEITPSGGPSTSQQVMPPLRHIYNVLPPEYRRGRPDLFPPHPPLHGGNAGANHGPSVAGNPLPQILPPPSSGLPTPPPSPPPPTGPPSPPGGTPH